jgi:2-polyprenyl-3-methyl-5-hydroxy-6-metoxy-1,4-benzoquinol methylase
VQNSVLFKPPELEVSLIIPARQSAETLTSTVHQAHRFLSLRYNKLFEILIVPNPAPRDQSDLSVTTARELSQRYAEVHSHPHFSPPQLPGKGAAIRTGLEAARGRFIFLTDADLPYDLSFFDLAIAKLRDGCALVTGNRRLPTSYFQIPVKHLQLAYSRHRLGLRYNRLVRTLLKIQTTDTQAGIKAMSRQLAQDFYRKQACPGFLFDLELFLSAQKNGYSWDEFPVTLHLKSEKSTVRVLRESFWVGFWLTRITWRNWMNAYAKPQGRSAFGLLQLYPGAALSTKFFLTARWQLTPYRKMASRLPRTGTILDLGCGHGLFSIALALDSPEREVLGIDHDDRRVTLAVQATQKLPHVKIQKGSLVDPPIGPPSYTGIAMIDVMHYLDWDTQELILRKAYDLLSKGGTLIVREVDPEAGLISQWNRLYEKIATGIGFTQAQKQTHCFRTQVGWCTLLENIGFQVRTERCSSILFADILYTCERTL